MKQRIEIEVDVPDEYEAECWRPPLKGEILLACDGQCVYKADRDYVEPRLILRRREPVRESRWRRVPLLSDRTFCMVFSRRDEAFDHAQQMGSRLERLDYEDGKLVSVELEEVGDG